MRMKKLHILLRRNFSTELQTNINSKLKWNSVVGLEIHAQITSKSKLFSGSRTAFGTPPNSCVSFFDCAIPGTLPVLNRRCVEAGVLTALALSCKLNEMSTFDRKHYFYADLPSGYQITQQRQPLAVDGICKFYVYNSAVHKQPYIKTSKIKQIQLEQDSGKSIHDEIEKKSLVDLNRAGVPLMEFVFEPDLKDGEEAAALVKELTLILKQLGTCSCKMEEGALRVDANISINKPNESLGVRTEVKNISSFRAVAKAIDYEIERQIFIMKQGGKIVNETRMWDAIGNKTVPMRDKEEKQDYRFMPEPNLPPLYLYVGDIDSENKDNLVNVVSLKKQLPELPDKTRSTLVEKYEIPLKTVLQIMNISNLLNYFTKVIEGNIKISPKQVANFLVTELLAVLYKYELTIDKCPIKPETMGQVINLLMSRTINIHTARNVMVELLSHPEKTAEQIIKDNEWYLITDEEELTKICQKVLKENPELVNKFKRGKIKVFKALLAIVAKTTNERANMSFVSKTMKELLK